MTDSPASSSHLVISSSSHVISPPPSHTLPTHATPFVGRQTELDYFAHQLHTKHLVVMSGMPGVGKSSLALALAQQTAPRQSIFWHSFQADEGIEALIWRLAGFLAERNQGELWNMLQNAQQPGAQLPPVQMLFDYLCQLLTGQSLLLCLDDLHHIEADTLTSALVNQLIGRHKTDNVSFIVTTRRLPTFTNWAGFRALEGLSLEDTQRLLVQESLPLADGFMYQLHADTEGNAQFLTLAIQALKQSSDPFQVLDHLAEADDLERYLLNQVNAQSSEEERAVMEAASIYQGHPCTRHAIEAIADGINGRNALLSLTDRHLVRVQTGDMGRVYQQHPILQAFFYSGLSRRRRQEMHYRAAEYYELDEQDLLQAAQHYISAGDATQSAKLVTSNTQQLIRQGRLRPLRRLLARFRDTQLEPSLWAAVNLVRGQICLLLEDRETARESFDLVRLLLEPISSSFINPFSEEQSDRSAGPQDDIDANLFSAQAHLGLAGTYEHEDLQKALEWAKRGLEAIGQSAQTGSQRPDEARQKIIAELHLKIGGIHAVMGDFSIAQQHIATGLEQLPINIGMEHIAGEENLGGIYFHQGQIDLAAQHWERGLALSQQLSAPFKMTDLRNNVGLCRLLEGRWAEAEAHFHESLEQAATLGFRSREALCTLNLAILSTWQGDNEAAEQYFEHLFTLTQHGTLEEFRINGKYSLADLRLRQGDLDAADALLTEAEQLVAEAQTHYQFVEIHRLQAQVELAQNQVETAHEYATRALKMAQEMGVVREEGIARGVLAQVLLAQGQADEAIAAFEESVRLLARRDRYETARNQQLLGHTLFTQGDSDQAEHLLQEAHAALTMMGAHSDAAALEFEQL
ncbi:tetratricopeptide repeat protein [Chloroflexi bacterium TSY]|nr:tetratricopeptide repeat protein [Chloroflexi bacterium TSY]